MPDTTIIAFRASRLRGLLLGTALGDSLGLPMEGMGPGRIARRFKGALRQRLAWGRGMVSDDTEHALFVGQALLAHPRDPRAFRRSLAWKLRFWLLGLPAGIGFATLRAILLMWLGVPRPGIRSAGNGPLMRAPLLGAALADDPGLLASYVEASTTLTHTDPRALRASLALARLAAWAVQEGEGEGQGERSRGQQRVPGRVPGGQQRAPGGDPKVPEGSAPLRRPLPEGLGPFRGAFLDEQALAALLLAGGTDPEWQTLVEAIAHHRRARTPLPAFAASLGLANGVTGYAYHTAPIAIYAWLEHPQDLVAVLSGIIALGGDTDSVAAVAGALVGATAGEACAPQALRDGLWDWPRGEKVWLEVADRLASGHSEPVAYFWPWVLLRNLLFLLVVLAHGLLRLLPPY